MLCAKIHNWLLREARKIFTYPGNVKTAPSTGADKQMVSSEVESSKCLDLSLKKSLKQSWIILKITTVISTCRWTAKTKTSSLSNSNELEAWPTPVITKGKSFPRKGETACFTRLEVQCSSQATLLFQGRNELLSRVTESKQAIDREKDQK